MHRSGPIQKIFDDFKERFTGILTTQKLDYEDVIREYDELIKMVKKGTGLFNGSMQPKLSQLREKLDKIKDQSAQFGAYAEELAKIVSRMNEDISHEERESLLDEFDKKQKQVVAAQIKQMEDLCNQLKEFIKELEKFFDTFNHSAVLAAFKERLAAIAAEIKGLIEKNQELSRLKEKNSDKIEGCNEQIKISESKIIVLNDKLIGSKKAVCSSFVENVKTYAAANGISLSPGFQECAEKSFDAHDIASEPEHVWAHSVLSEAISLSKSELLVEQKDKLESQIIAAMRKNPSVAAMYTTQQKILQEKDTIKVSQEAIQNYTSENEKITAEIKQNKQKIDHLQEEASRMSDRATEILGVAQAKDVPEIKEIQKAVAEVKEQVKQIQKIEEPKEAVVSEEATESTVKLDFD